MSMRLFHTTTDPQLVLAGGFRSSSGSFGFASTQFDGVFLSRRPAGVNEGATGDGVLEVVFGDNVDLTPFAIADEGREPWEWCVPIELVNRAQIRALSVDEVDQLAWWT